MQLAASSAPIHIEVHPRDMGWSLGAPESISESAQSCDGSLRTARGRRHALIDDPTISQLNDAIPVGRIFL